jgi:hypothetical protein
MSIDTAVRHPRIGDAVLLWDTHRGTIVLLRSGYATLDADDDVRVQVPADMLRWVADRDVWVVVTEEPEEPLEPLWAHEDPRLEQDPYKAGLEQGRGYHDVQAE